VDFSFKKSEVTRRLTDTMKQKYRT